MDPSRPSSVNDGDQNGGISLNKSPAHERMDLHDDNDNDNDNSDYEDGYDCEEPDSDSAANDSDGEDVIPTHPIPELQEAFEESIIEAAEDVQYETTPTSATHPSAEARRHELLEQHVYDDSWNTRWKQKPSARCHPLTKLVAQIIFGMHLLANHQAKSDAEVVKILQAHVDDIDGFLEKTTDDFDLAIADIEERRAFLQLPMTHQDVFAIMLEDKPFRTQLLDGNDKIERIIARSAKAMNAALADVQQGINATQDLAKYLDDVGPEWPRDYSELPAIYTAMRGNQEGWLGCFQNLQMKGNKLGVALVQLGTTIAEMSRLAAAASRRSKHISVAPPRSKYASGCPELKQSSRSNRLSHHSLDKPLPVEPDPLQPAVRATLPRSRHRHHPSIEERLDEPERQSHTPSRHTSTSHRRTPSNLQPREPQSPRSGETSIMATFIRNTGPPDSHPPLSRESVSLSHPSRPIINDSAYSSGSDPAAEKREKKRLNTPARFGLFPDSKPATPDSLSRSTSYMTAPMTAPSQTKMSSPLGPKPGHFSLRRIFHRKHRTQEVI